VRRVRKLKSCDVVLCFDSASEMTYIVSDWALNSTHSLTHSLVSTAPVGNYVTNKVCDMFKVTPRHDFVVLKSKNVQTAVF